MTPLRRYVFERTSVDRESALGEGKRVLFYSFILITHLQLGKLSRKIQFNDIQQVDGDRSNPEGRRFLHIKNQETLNMLGMKFPYLECPTTRLSFSADQARATFAATYKRTNRSVSSNTRQHKKKKKDIYLQPAGAMFKIRGATNNIHDYVDRKLQRRRQFRSLQWTQFSFCGYNSPELGQLGLEFLSTRGQLQALQ